MPKAPPRVRLVAARALARRRKHGRGGTAVGVARARDLARGADIPVKTLKRMVSFFARHEKSPGSAAARRDSTSAASISWGLWGGSAGYAWAKRELRKAEKT